MIQITTTGIGQTLKSIVFLSSLVLLPSLSYAQDDDIEELRQPTPVVSEKPKAETPKTVEKKTTSENSANSEKKPSTEKPKTENKPSEKNTNLAPKPNTEKKPSSDKPTNSEKKPNTEKPNTDKKIISEKEKPKPTTEKKPVVEKKPTPEKVVNDKPVAKVVTPPPAPVCPTAELNPDDKLLIKNAEDLDKLNKELSIKNQEMQQLNEKLSLQLEVLKHDRYSEGTRDTLMSIAAGLLLGWFFFRQKKRSYRDFR
ncbi:MAG TPA: hypothetical protein PKN43_08900 [Agitococcus sp.]|nr:hypothetical protein [Agitococcus sp.]